jgi:prefoldin subunit 5
LNQSRRKRIREVITKLNDCSSNLETIKDEEDEAREGIPENLQTSELYSCSEESSDRIDEAISELQEAVDSLENIT